MPTFEDSARSEAPPEQVWKLLYDPTRFPGWWTGVETTAPEEDQRAPEGGEQGYTMYPEGYPDFPMPQMLRARGDERRVQISCLVSDLRFDWLLEELDGGRATAISVHVEIPEEEAHRLAAQQEVIRSSLTRLAALAAR